MAASQAEMSVRAMAGLLGVSRSGYYGWCDRGASRRARADERLKVEIAVPHAFRASFRDWAAECTDAPREICELALGHANTNSIEAAYRRTFVVAARVTLQTHEISGACPSGRHSKIIRRGRAARSLARPHWAAKSGIPRA